MARKRKQTADEDEIDALVDDLDEELEEDVEVEEDEDEDVVDEDDEDEDDDEGDPDEAPKRGRKAKAKKAKAEKSGVGTAEVAEAAGVEPRQLRMYLRSREIQGGEDREGRYHWPSLQAKEVQRIIKDIKKGAVDKLNKEKLADLKGRKGKKATAKKTTSKKTTTRKRVKK